MMYTVMVAFHVLGACVWIGGHAVLLTIVLPGAMKRGDVESLARFERGLGRLGLAALVVQLATGLWLAHRWLGHWGALFADPTPQSHLIMSKIVVLVLLIVAVGYRYHRVLPSLTVRGLRWYAMLTAVATALAVVLLVLGIGIRFGGLL